jgi:hypothetical protein
MDDERRNDVGGGIVVGCLALGLLVAVLMLGAAGLWLFRSSVRIEEATVVEEEARQVQVSDITEEEKATSQQDATQAEVK